MIHTCYKNGMQHDEIHSIALLHEQLNMFNVYYCVNIELDYDMTQRTFLTLS